MYFYFHVARNLKITYIACIIFLPHSAVIDSASCGQPVQLCFFINAAKVTYVLGVHWQTIKSLKFDNAFKGLIDIKLQSSNMSIILMNIFIE